MANTASKADIILGIRVWAPGRSTLNMSAMWNRVKVTTSPFTGCNVSSRVNHIKPGIKESDILTHLSVDLVKINVSLTFDKLNAIIITTMIMTIMVITKIIIILYYPIHCTILPAKTKSDEITNTVSKEYVMSIRSRQVKTEHWKYH